MKQAILSFCLAAAFAADEGQYQPDSLGGYVADEEGRYFPDNSGQYVPDYSGRYIYDPSGIYKSDGTGGYTPERSKLFITLLFVTPKFSENIKFAVL